MKISKTTTLHILLLAGAFVVALALRLIRLGNLPLTDMEADVALQALAIARGSSIRFGPHMTYVGLTGISFFIFNSGNFMARFWPGFLGSLIVFVPFLFRDRIGHWPATVLSLVLSISPEMVGLSRVIGSPMIAFVCIMLALGFWLNEKPIFTGVALALGLMGGSGFWLGGLILGVSFLILKWLFKSSEDIFISLVVDKRSFVYHSIVSFIVTLLVIGTGFFMAPDGMSGIFSGLFSFVQGFAAPYPMSNMLLPLILVAYTLVAILLGIWGGLRGVLMKDKLDMFLLVWWVFGLTFILLYPGGVPGDLIWVTLPLWVLSARVTYFAWRFPENARFVTALTAVLVVVVSAFMLIMMRSFVRPDLTQNQQINHLVALVGGVVLLVAIILLITYGWSEDVARAGILIGLAIVLSAGLFSVSVNSTGLAPEVSLELWYPEEAYLSPEWMIISIDRVLERNSKRATPIEIAVSDFGTPAMQWVMRDYDPVYFTPYLPPQTQPGMLITAVQDIPEISSSYRGQDLVWSRNVLWEEMTSFQYLNWLITREAPTRANQIIFWVRTDLLPDG